MKTSIVNNAIVVEIEMGTPTASASGKTLVVASSHGNITTDVMVNGKPVTIGLNAYISANNRPYAKNEEKCAVIKGKNLVVTIPMQPAAPSASGKTMVVATTRGNIVTNASASGKNIVLGFNAYYHNR